MTKDQTGLLAILLLVGAVIAGVLNLTTVAWVLVALAIGLIVYAKLRK